MGLKDIFNASNIKRENDNLKQLLTPEMQDAANLMNKISELEKSFDTLCKSVSKKEEKLNQLNCQIEERKKDLITFNDDILVQEFGLYQPRYSYSTSDEYKEQLLKIRSKQKSCIHANHAVDGDMYFKYNNNNTQGVKMVRDMQKLLLRAFNSECDETIHNVKYNNYDMSFKKICSSRDSIERYGKMLKIKVTDEYFNLKSEELTLTLEYQIKKQNEKEELKAARAEQREQAKLEREIEEQRKKIEKEHTHYDTAYQKLKLQLEACPDNAELLAKKAEYEEKLSDIDKALNDIDYRQANLKAGYVYIISNIGAFGENVFKIGMTRRLDPQDRIDELGDASVPFNFDVHAMIFSNDAPALETALHHAFENRKLNMVNQRREFFNVTLDEIKSVVKNNFDKTVEFIDVPDAEQYRISLKMKEH
ncbi:MAG: DUF4041 domain-containing protein [bacterium]|nr:DUF4041 domain-containing protein [bacterium]